MGTAIAAGVLDATASSNQSRRQPHAPNLTRVIACVHSQLSVERVKSTLARHQSRLTVTKGQHVAAMQEADIVLIACKPVKLYDVLRVEGVQSAVRGKLLISVVAGITAKDIAVAIDDQGEVPVPDCRIIRTMPNMAAMIRESMTIIASPPDVDVDPGLAVTQWIFDQVGRTRFVDDSLFDITAVAVGCAGSLIMLAIDGLLDACVAEGVKRSEAQEMAAQAVLGNVRLLLDGGNTPSALRELIASPGGCSIRALLSLERSGVRPAYSDALIEAASCSRAMASRTQLQAPHLNGKL